MRLVVVVETDPADDGLDKPRSYQEHAYEIGELLRMENYYVDYVDEVRDGE